MAEVQGAPPPPPAMPWAAPTQAMQPPPAPQWNPPTLGPLGVGYGGYASLQTPPTAAAPNRLQVHSEDCEALQMRPSPAASPSNALAPRGSRGRSRQEVYVQDLRDNRRFRSVSNRRAIQAMNSKAGAKERDREGLGAPTLRSSRSSALNLQSLVLLDSDVSKLTLLDPSDASIAEQLLACWRCQVFAAACCFICQVLLAGFSLASLLLAVGGEEAATARLWPYQGGVLQVLSQVSAVGSLQNASRVLQAFKIPAPSEEHSAGLLLRRLMLTLLHSSANVALIVVCALASSRTESSGPSYSLLLAEGLLAQGAFLFGLPEAARLMSSSPRRFFERQKSSPGLSNT
ncbi:unnamed protein product [Symbiodinium sp. CCMP2592]|nr:unnamed protein product [Symbiodinium sp. CCMP2592]